jgi:peptide/nickel transport system substrate-binding protein
MVRLLRLETGEVDMVVDLPAKDEGRLRRSAPEIRIYPISGRLFGYLNYNLHNPLLKDSRVRRAISHAIDRRAFTENLMFGRAQPAGSIIVPALAWAHDPDRLPDELDVERSKTLLRESGFLDRDGDGVIERGGRPFEIQITTRTGDPVRENGILILQENLSRVGIRVRIRMMEAAAALAEVKKGDYDVYYGHFQSRLSVDPTMLVGTGGPVNYGDYSDAKMDELIRQGLSTMDREQARVIWYEFQEYFAEQQPWTMLYYFDTLVGIRDDFRNCTPDNLSPFYRLERWWKVPEADPAPR